ncbi:lactoylglutathione lyase [Caedibacter taeniospiralis]|uniref:lactoylglutathione lyase n=1 Tax=Caedibacter taeniospiralis TaxID=28907 RepID=UPI000C274200|nr:lactoylglutathione lyase [Caedibacter taeniospiralis]
MRLAHMMIRVNNLEESIAFYRDIFGMTLFKQTDNEAYRYTLAFMGYGNDINQITAVELTYNWDTHSYDHGKAFGHLCIEVDDVYQSCDAIKQQGGVVTREAGPVKGGTSIIAFVKDPNGYQIELIGKKVR